MRLVRVMSGGMNRLSLAIARSYICYHYNTFRLAIQYPQTNCNQTEISLTRSQNTMDVTEVIRDPEMHCNQIVIGLAGSQNTIELKQILSYANR